MIQSILYSLLSVGCLGGLFGLGLAIASKFLSVQKDKRIESAAEVLPGLNCGSCGYAGCDAYAEAVVLEEEKIDLCKPGGADTLEALGGIMDVAVGPATDKQVARVHCRGGIGVAVRTYEYDGYEDCNAAVRLYGGGKKCTFGCLGHGSCAKVCPVDAISKTDDGLVRVDPDLCISCEKCVDICPTGVMKMVPYSADMIVACNSTDKGGVVRKYCSVGCIACKRCEKKSPEGGFIVEDFLASIDYAQTGDRTEAKETCPTNTIVSLIRSAVASGSREDD